MPTLSITATTQQAQRLVPAVGDAFKRNEGEGDVAFVERYLKHHLGNLVWNYEEKLRKQAAEASGTPLGLS